MSRSPDETEVLRLALVLACRDAFPYWLDPEGYWVREAQRRLSRDTTTEVVPEVSGGMHGMDS